MEINDLTPVEQYDGLLYKRDDLFLPFGKYGTSGGKVRQALSLIGKNVDNIIENHKSTIVTHTQVHSTTGTILTRVCKHYNLKCIVCVGGTTSKSLKKHHMMMLAEYWGGHIRNVCGHGMHAPVMSRLRELVKQEKYFNAVFSDNVNLYPESVLDTTANQVKNIPEKLDNMIISVGSGIQMAGILRGIVKHKKQVKNIYGVCIGPDRRKKINYYANPFEYFPLPNYKMITLDTTYGKGITEFFDGGQMDELYEAKAFKWMKDNIDTKEKTLFWIVGRRLTKQEVRDKYNCI
jgi:1-aminocyclopropane-1-carboxylate deaminase/D-cysteine desulfhydrase-like pyridoxal-dependent ACC family enzyme